MQSAVVNIINELQSRGAMKGSDIANLADVSPATVSRWASGQVLPHPKKQLVISDLKYVVDRLAEIYTPDETRVWLYGRHLLLEGKRPIDLIHNGETETVLGAIESLDAGEYL